MCSSDLRDCGTTVPTLHGAPGRIYGNAPANLLLRTGTDDC